jgi:predicted anti-sigma-YlaC factor YlaD
MRCENSRARIQEWLDTPGATAMSPEIGEHIRECTECRGFIKKWNSIELGLQSMREQAPQLSSDFSFSVQSRIQAEQAASRSPWSFRPWHFALVGASAAALFIAMFFHFSGGVRTNRGNVHNPASSLAAAREAAPNHSMEPTNPSLATFPLVGTGR